MASLCSGRPSRPTVFSFSLFCVCALSACSKKEAMKLPTPEVYVTKAVARDVPVGMELVGQTAGSKDVEIRARVEGYLDAVNFRDGDFVNQGESLYTIDPKSFEATVAQAKAQVATMKARVDNAEIEEARLKPLAEQQAVSRRDYDNAVASRDAARAQLDAAKAQLDRAQLDLGYTRISAPVSGLADFTRVKAGNLVGRGESTLLTTISVVDPIYFTASITESDYLKFAQKAVSAGSAAPNAKREAELVLADGSVYDHKGRLDAVQRAVDAKTGTLAVRLLFANPDRVVRPGQYGRIRFVSEVLPGAVCVPQKAVQELQGVQQVYVVGEGNKVEVRTVKMGPRFGDLWAVSEGLKAGETVIVEGLQSARPGGEVVPKPVEPAASPAAPAAAPAPAGK
jgi:membrane fusion protein (multidrug efflux system)